ncbi:MAG: DUF4249 family protein [Bacteroidetes bacterium]|nr:DUF4249 family protein [Bacteroidota bacterium]MDA1336763.1 DUF4249 family protein [Bacteroidota bacterium]
MFKTPGLLEALAMMLLLLLVACEQEVEVDLPTTEPLLVVEGTIFQGSPPVVFIGESQGYFDPVDANSIGQAFLSGGIVHVNDGENTYSLDELCTSDLSPELLEVAEDLLGFPAELLAVLDLCVYTSFDPVLVGESGKTYELDVTYQNHSLSASTTIIEPVQLDSAWFQAPGTLDTLGLMYAQFTDPDTLGNAYRWFAKRINRRPDWDEMAGEIKDADFVAPLGSVFDDAFFNGLNFEFGTFRGVAAGSTAWDDDFASSSEAGYFKSGDTVVVRFCSIDDAVFRSVQSYENLILSQGSPFAPPANMLTNVEGGLGLWAGYGIYQDTVICP